MLLLGLLLLCATGAFTGLLIAYNTSGGPDYTVAMFGNTLGTLNSLQVFLAGIALALVFCLSLAMTLGGASMWRRRQVARRAERRDAVRARAERDALAARLEEDPAYAGDVTTPASEASSQTRTQSEDPTVASTTRKHHRMPHVFGH
jgi:hypothetical protein